ncbi:non-homologous end-joining DNA ligase [Brevibacillus daliensis]|uniref:non-homologous end-joining DNA ligase n=1 Tax=Brevibacillus daliensis TaxID=2892995 RepID=UPI001E5A8926|nr:non-homologous end-joining DNA ligase [Brevibacillus daliensis]
MATTKSYSLIVDNKELAITNPDKLLWPKAGITKLHYLQYLVEIAPFLLPYTRDRYVTVIRFPHGVGDQSFYQKNLPTYAPDWIHRATDGKINYALLNDTATLIWMANQAALEFHVSFHLVQNDLPTELVFDLDPSTSDFSDVITASLALKSVLDDLQLQSYPKTSGASGIQVYVPIRHGYSFEQTRKVGSFICTYLVQRYPEQLTIERLVKNRGTKLYLDYLQHWRGKTLPAPYSTRAQGLATVSAPLSWTEIEKVHPSLFTIHTMIGRTKQVGDLFQPLLSTSRNSLDHILNSLPTS